MRSIAVHTVGTRPPTRTHADHPPHPTHPAPHLGLASPAPSPYLQRVAPSLALYAPLPVQDVYGMAPFDASAMPSTGAGVPYPFGGVHRDLQYMLPLGVGMAGVPSGAMEMHGLIADGMQIYNILPGVDPGGYTAPHPPEHAQLPNGQEHGTAEGRNGPAAVPSPVPSAAPSPLPQGPALPPPMTVMQYATASPGHDAVLEYRTDGTVGTFSKRVKTSIPSQADPYAAAFLHDQLGTEKWQIFTSRLYERRFCGQKPKPRQKAHECSDTPDAKAQSASVVDFLVKVEVVKEVLRTYVPHPYNPLKSLAHVYAAAPAGQVTLTRSTVLALSGWSNTQFAYWARRAEAVAVLAPHDARLRAVAGQLERRLRGAPAPSPPAPGPGPPDEGDGEAVTGKGLDALVDEVKKRTGASPFLRGRHASLDAFGAPPPPPPAGTLPAACAAPVYMPTFQAQMYRHSPPPSAACDGRSEAGSGHAPGPPSDSCARARGGPEDGARRARRGGRRGSSAEGEGRDLFPVSDSRSEAQTRQKRRADHAQASGDAPSAKKRTR